MKVSLKSVGNPDFRQDPRRGLPGVRAKKVKVADFAEASKVCLEYIREHDLGGGNWVGGEVTDDTGAVVAKVSYNGRVWPPGTWTPGMKPLL